MRTTMVMPSQNALKLPAMRPDKMLSEAPPSREEVTTSLTWLDSVDVKILTSSGMIAPASVPHVMTVESFHHSVPSPRSLTRTHEARYVIATDTNDVSHTSRVSGASKFMRCLEVHAGDASILGAHPGLVDQIRRAAGHDHEHAHQEDPDQELDLHRRLADGEQDERDERDTGDAVGLEPVRARSDGVACVVARAVGDHTRVAGVVLLDVEDDLHQVGADVGDLGEDPARDTEGGRAQRLADGEADEAGTSVVSRDEEEDAEHQEQLDADKQHPDAHAGLERDRVDRIGLPLQAGEGRA